MKEVQRFMAWFPLSGEGGMKTLSMVPFELWNKISLSSLKTDIVGKMDDLAVSSHPSVTRRHSLNSCHICSFQLNLTRKRLSQPFHVDFPVFIHSPCCSFPDLCLTVYLATQIFRLPCNLKISPCLPVSSVLMFKIYPWEAESKTNCDCQYHRRESLVLSKRCALNRMQEFFRAFKVSGDGILIPEQTEPLWKQKGLSFLDWDHGEHK